jgi:hypothetical protein
MKTSITSLLIYTFVVSVGFARKVGDWSYERLFKEADLVMIGSVEGWGSTKAQWSEKIFDKALKVKSKEEGEANELKPKRAGKSVVSPPEYLLFLKMRQDGLYEPVSGQLDAAFSVRALFLPNNIKVP